MNPCIWKKAVRKNVHQKAMESCNRDGRRICTKKREGISLVEEGERRGARVYQ